MENPPAIAWIRDQWNVIQASGGFLTACPNNYDFHTYVQAVINYELMIHQTVLLLVYSYSER